MITQDVHARSLRKSEALSLQQVERALSPTEVISVLNRSGVSFVLVGAHGISGWLRKPRATEDVDLVVALKHIKKATRELLRTFPHLEAEDHEVVVRLKERGSQDVVIDLMKPVQTLYRETFRHTLTVHDEGQTYRIPSLEMALTMKFAAMLSPHRREDYKLQDTTDFVRMIFENQDIDTQVLSQLGELVYVGGGKRITELVEDVRAGRKLVL